MANIESPLSKDTTIAVVGAGAMGAGIAQVAAISGHKVLLIDTRDGAALQAIENIKVQWQKLVDKGKYTPELVKNSLAGLQVANSIQDLACAGLVIEAIIESLEAKQQLFADLESIVNEECLFATNTSSISITAIASSLKKPERLAGMHFFNPAPIMKLVEIIKGLATSQDNAKILFDTAKAWGKQGVMAKSTPGFIVNRVARSYYGEALRLYQEGAADIATLDGVMREAGGFRMGAFELMDLIGSDVNFAVSSSVWKAFFYDQRFLPSFVQQELVDAKYYGRKTKRGFYDYNEGAIKPEPKNAKSDIVLQKVHLYGASLLVNALKEKLVSAAISITLNEAHSDGRIADFGSEAGVLYLTDGRTATGRAYKNNINDCALVDLTVDFNKASRLAISFAENCSANAQNNIIALLQSASYQVSILRDVAGMAVMRTVATLVNEGADAVNQGVCSVADVDISMRLGVNYPLGPLEWADKLGVSAIREVLVNIGKTYGEDRYRISPLIHQLHFSKKKFYDKTN